MGWQSSLVPPGDVATVRYAVAIAVFLDALTHVRNAVSVAVTDTIRPRALKRPAIVDTAAFRQHAARAALAAGACIAFEPPDKSIRGITCPAVHSPRLLIAEMVPAPVTAGVHIVVRIGPGIDVGAGSGIDRVATGDVHWCGWCVAAIVSDVIAILERTKSGLRVKSVALRPLAAT